MACMSARVAAVATCILFCSTTSIVPPCLYIVITLQCQVKRQRNCRSTAGEARHYVLS